MKKVFSSAFLLVFLSSMMVLGALLTKFTMSVEADSIIRVPADYPTIQEAINAASPGNVVLVTSGIYYEHVTVNKPLMLVGEDKATTIIDGNGTGTAVSITADIVVVDGFTIRNSSDGIYLTQSSGSTITGNIITSNVYGIVLYNSTNNTITGNIISYNWGGVPSLSWGGGMQLLSSNCNLIRGNTVTNNLVGLSLDSSNNNSVIGNTVKDSIHLDHSNNNSLTGNTIFGVGLHYSNNNTIIGNTITGVVSGPVISLDYSNGNIIYHNNFINPHPFAGGPFRAKTAISRGGTNIWNNGTEGNYWSDYTGLDDGSDDRVMGDNIGDTNLPHLGLDHYPLTVPWGPVPIVYNSATYPVELVSNSTISVFRFDHNRNIRFNVTGPPGTVGFCNVTIPKNLFWGKYYINIMDHLYADPQELDYIRADNDTHAFLYFTYTHSTPTKARIITIWAQYRIPEIHTWMSILLMVIMLTFTMVIYKRRLFCCS